MRRLFGSVPSTGPWALALATFFVGIALLLIGASSDLMAMVVVGGILVAIAGLSGMFYGEKAAGELAQGPEPGRGRRRQGRSRSKT